MSGQNSIAISNVVGSNIFNILVVLGICSIIVPVKVDYTILKREFPFALGSSVVLIVMLVDSFYKNTENNMLSRVDGGILLLLFSAFMYII